MLSKIISTNFQSWKNLEFTVSTGVTIIDGWNEDDQTSEGSGKSAVLNSLSWNLFGKLPKEAKVDEVIKEGEDFCDVETHYSNGDVIHRSRNPNELYIKIAGKIIKGKDAKETQQLIEEYIGLNFETFCQSTYFAQNYDKKFLPSNQEDKGKILSSIQNVQVFDKARAEVMKLQKVESDNQVQLRNKINVGLTTLTGLNSQKGIVAHFIKEKIQKHEMQLTLLENRKKQSEYAMNETQLKIISAEDALTSIHIETVLSDEASLNTVRPQYVQQLMQIRHDKSQIDTIIQGLKAKEKEGQDLAAKYGALQDRIASNTLANSSAYGRNQVRKAGLQDINKNQTFVRLQAKRTTLVNFIKNPTKNCPSCGTLLQTMDTSHAQNEVREIDVEIQQLVDIVNQDIDVLDREVLQIQAELLTNNEKTSEEMAQIFQRLNEIGDYLDANSAPSVEAYAIQEGQVVQSIQQIDAALAKVQSDKAEYSKYKSNLEVQKGYLDFAIQGIHQVVAEIKAHGSPDVAADQHKLLALDSDIQKTTEVNAQIQQLLIASETYATRLETLKDGFKEIKSYVFNNALNELNFRTNQYLSELFTMDAKIKFTNEDQKIESTIMIGGRTTSLGLLSGGQNRRFNLAVDLAISDIVASRKSSKLNILALDEYFKDLSEVSMEKCLDLLSKRKSPVILIEHNTLFKNIVNNTFFARLKNGTTTESKAS